MGKEEVERIKKIFSDLGVEVEYFEHEPVITSHEAARTRGVSLNEGVKAIVFTNEEKFVTALRRREHPQVHARPSTREQEGLADVVVCVPADRKVDVRKVCDFLGWVKSKTRMATHEEVLEVTGCEVGAVPPFGHRMGLKILIDSSVFSKGRNSFNIGLRTHSARVASGDLRRVLVELGASEGEFAQ